MSDLSPSKSVEVTKQSAADADFDHRLARLRKLSEFLDSNFRVPGTQWRFGYDGLLGILPGIGDSITGLLSLFLVIEGYRLGARPRVLVAMMFNALLDYVLGLVPVVGDLADFVHKANVKNLKLLISHLESRGK